MVFKLQEGFGISHHLRKVRETGEIPVCRDQSSYSGPKKTLLLSAMFLDELPEPSVGKNSILLIGRGSSSSLIRKEAIFEGGPEEPGCPVTQNHVENDDILMSWRSLDPEPQTAASQASSQKS